MPDHPTPTAVRPAVAAGGDDFLVVVDALSAHLLELVRRHDDDIFRWPDALEDLSHIVLHGS